MKLIIRGVDSKYANEEIVKQLKDSPAFVLKRDKYFKCKHKIYKIADIEVIQYMDNVIVHVEFICDDPTGTPSTGLSLRNH